MEARGVLSDEMRALYEAQRRAHETVLTLQAQIEDEEAVYLDETPHGNILRGWDGFLDSKQPRKDHNLRKLRPYTESEHLFSNSCLYASMASEPRLEHVADIYDTSKDEGGAVRKLTVTLCMGKGTGVSGSISGVLDSTVSAVTTAASGDRGHVDLLSMPKTVKTVAPVAMEKAPPPPPAAAALSYQQSKAAKLKKRKRDGEMEVPVPVPDAAGGPAPAVVGSVQETVVAGAGSAGAAVMAQPPASDFLDVL